MALVLRERANVPMSIIPQQIECDHPNCGLKRKEVNHWFAVLADDSGVKIFEWSKAPQNAVKRGKHFCGVAHALLYVSSLLTPDKTDLRRESTLELKPPLKRDGEEHANESTVQ